MLVSGVQQSEFVIHIHISTLLKILFLYKLLEYWVSCAIQKVLIIYFICSSMHMSISVSQFISPPFPSNNHKFVFYICDSIPFVFLSICCCYLVAKLWPALFETPWTVGLQAPLSMEFPRQAYWSKLPFPSPGDPPDPGIEPTSPKLQVDSLPVRHLGNFIVLSVDRA